MRGPRAPIDSEAAEQADHRVRDRLGVDSVRLPEREREARHDVAQRQLAVGGEEEERDDNLRPPKRMREVRVGRCEGGREPAFHFVERLCHTTPRLSLF